MKQKIRYLLKDINTKSKLFYAFMFLCMLITFISGLASDGQSITNMLFNRDDIFMDFFNSINDCADDAYGEYGVIYPPLVVLFYRFFSCFFESGTTSHDMRDTSLGMMCFVLLTIICLYLIVKCFTKFKNGNNADKALFLFFTITSLPMIYLLERGNILIIVISLILMFVYGYDSDKPLIRHIAFISLAIAVSIKIYPVIFGLVLLRKKNNIKNILWCILYGILFFFVPFLFLGGFSQVFVLIKNILYTSSMFAGNGYGFKVNITNTFDFIGALVDHPYIFSVIGNAILFITAIIGIVLTLFAKFDCEWKLFAIPSLFIILIPGFSYIYCITYMLIVLLMFLNEEKKSKLDIVYLVLFVLQFALIFASNKSVFDKLSDFDLKLNLPTVIESISLLLMIILLYTETIIKNLKLLKGKKLFSTKLPITPVIAVFLAGVIAVSSCFSVGYTASKSGFAITNLEMWQIDEENTKDVKTVEAVHDYLKDNFKDNKILMFPKVDFTNEIAADINADFFDISYYDNSLKNIDAVKSESPDVVLIYSVAKYDVTQTNKSYSIDEFNSYFDMNKEIHLYVLDNGYEKINSYYVNTDYEISVWKKTDNKKRNKWYESGKGTYSDPYVISSTQQFLNFANAVNFGHTYYNKYIILSTDIDLSDCTDFEPIGYERYGAYFNGTFDGNGYAIKNLNLVKPKRASKNEIKNNIGIFGSLSGTVVNLVVKDCNFEGLCVGVFARSAKKGTTSIINCISMNNTINGYRCGEFVDDFGGVLCSCVAINNKGYGDINYGINGHSGSVPQATSCFSTRFSLRNTSGNISLNMMNTPDFAESLYYSSLVCNDRRLLAARNTRLSNHRIKNEKNKAKVVEKRLNICEWEIKDGVLSLVHH